MEIKQVKNKRLLLTYGYDIPHMEGKFVGLIRSKRAEKKKKDMHVVRRAQKFREGPPYERTSQKY